MMVYNFSIPTSATLATGTNIGALTATAGAGTGRSAMITEIDFEGAGSASGFCQIGLYRVSGTTLFSGGTPVTPVSVDSPALSGTTPALAANTACIAGAVSGGAVGALVHSFGINFNGQRYFWRANPNLNNAIVIPPTTAASNQIVIQTIIVGAGTAAPVTGRIQFVEM
jgi:hypothetical protein